ncbi:MAG: YcjX family protein, partial [Planctomycetes bacterium]|nr:YcjX family protein [Planctomycetota bacterium]
VHMIRHDSFAGWSDQLLELWHSYDRLREHTAGYVDALRRQGMDKSSVDASERRILAAYKAALAGMVHDKYQLITPSTFILGPNGSDGFTDADIANHGAERLSGLPGGEFAPLDRQARHDNPELAGEFSYRYQQYRDQVVLPLFAAINHCDRLLLLVDIPGILSGGVGRYNDTNHMIEILAENIRPSGWFFTNVDKAAFIAAKSDMIHPRDIDNLQALVEDMMRIARNRQPGIGYQAFTASAWVSAHPVELADGGRALRGIPRRDTEERVFRVPELRPDWPHDWGPEDPRYSYPLLSPPRLANRYLAPEQHNLDKIFDFIFA